MLQLIKRYRPIASFLCLLLVGVAPVVYGSSGQNLVYLNTIWQINGSSFGCPINVQNEVELGRLVVPLQFKVDAYLQIDSISLAGTRLDGLGTTATWFDNVSGLFYIDFTADPGSPLGIGDGAVAYAYFTSATNSPAVDYDIDTTFIAPDKEFYLEDETGTETSAGFVPGVIHIVTHVPIIDLEPRQFLFETTEGIDPDPQTLNVYNLGVDYLNWHISFKPSWLEVSPEEGTAPSVVSLAPKVSSLAVGSYYDSVAVTDSISANHTMWAWIELRIGPATPEGLSGWIRDTLEADIVDAAVEAWDFWSTGTALFTTSSAVDGAFAFPSAPDGNYQLYAYKNGYYPTVMDATAPDDNVIVHLTPTPTPNPTDQWITLQCNENYFEGNLLPVGSVVEAYDQSGTICGQFFVTTVGEYGPMKVYLDDPDTPADEGADVGEALQMEINMIPATAWPPPVWTFNGDEQYVCLNTTPVDTVCIDLDAGWSLVSWNVDTYDDNIESIISNIKDCVDVILGFEVGSATYDPLLPQFSTLDYLDHFHGYWFRMNCPAELCITGIPVDAQTPINLETNWNLVSYLPNDTLATPDALNSMISDLVVALGFDHGGMTYETAHPELATLLEMRPTLGYWLKTTTDVALVYPGAIARRSGYVLNTQTMKARPVAAGVLPTPEWVDFYGDGITLDGKQLPVGANVQFRDEQGNLCGACQVEVAGHLPFVPVYKDDPSTEVDEGANVGSTIHVTVDGADVDQEFVWTGVGQRTEIGELTSSEKSAQSLPTNFQLAQNYPNPFNPSTVISFSMPVAAQARLEVFNVLGKKVKTLIDQYLPAGEYQAYWDGTLADGSRAASAMYLYRLTADGFSVSRKMLLVK
jgi:hypothetical protein